MNLFLNLLCFSRFSSEVELLRSTPPWSQVDFKPSLPAWTRGDYTSSTPPCSQVGWNALMRDRGSSKE